MKSMTEINKFLPGDNAQCFCGENHMSVRSYLIGLPVGNRAILD